MIINCSIFSSFYVYSFMWYIISDIYMQGNESIFKV
jgi:hypothetical protein